MSKTWHRHLQSQRGISLVEMLIASVIFLFVAGALGSMYLSSNKAFNESSALSFVQRQGTLVAQELQNRLLPASTIQLLACGPAAVAAGESLIYYRPDNATFWCLYRFKAVTDLFPQLYACRIAWVPASPPRPCADSLSDLLTGAPQGAQLRVSAVDFKVGITSATANISFDLTDGTLYTPLRFGFTATTRN